MKYLPPRQSCLTAYGAANTHLKELYGEIESSSEGLMCFQHEGTPKDPFDWLRGSESLLLCCVGVIINGALNPEVSQVSRCQGRLCPGGIICSHCSAPLPVCPGRKNNGFFITLSSSGSHACLRLTIINSLHLVCPTPWRKRPITH